MNALRLRVLATIAAVVVIVVAHLGVLDDAGRAHADAALRRALVAYGVARGLNGVISVAQGTEVAVEPAGVGLTFKPGEILDPVNDLIERFSWILLVSGTSLGVQRVLLSVTAFPLFSMAVSFFILASLWVVWAPHSVGPRIRGVVIKAAAALVIVRFAIPLVAVASSGLYQTFLEPQYVESTRKLEQAAATIKNASDGQRLPAPERDGSLLDSALRAYRSARDAVDIDERIGVLKAAAADAGEYTIDLIVVFLLDTILFPLTFLWLTVQLLKRTVRATP